MEIKGVSQKAVMVDKNHFIQEEWGGISKQQYYLRYGRKPGEYWILYVKKEIKEEIKKGQLTASGDIQPYNFMEE
jgi:hypothetical protein